MGREGETRRTVLVALAANLSIAFAKAIGGVASGSAAMLAEAAHSLADTTNQVFLLLSIRLGTRAADRDHPFGHGQERFFWSFLAAVFMFVAGGVFSIAEGVYRLTGSSSEKSSFPVAYAVLAVALIAEGVSLVRAVRQTRGQAREAGLPYRVFVRQTRDPTTKTVVFEDSAAVVGVLIALAGVALHEVTGSSAWDAGASIAIGVLLMAIAFAIGHDTRHLLIGASARPDEHEDILRAIRSFDGVDHVLDLRTMVLAPHALLVAARIDLADGLESDQVEQLSNEIEKGLREANPDVAEVFLDATPADRRPRSAV
jgi:cation diffusion facilitator family transporter